MSLISLDNAGGIGLVKDPQVDSIPVEGWSVLNNVRCKNRSLNSIGQDSDVYTSHWLETEQSAVIAPLYALKGMDWSVDGTKVFFTGLSGTIERHTASSAFDISTIGGRDHYYTIGSGDGHGLQWEDDGLEAWFMVPDTVTLTNVHFTVPWDLTSDAGTNSYGFSLIGEEDDPVDFSFCQNGTVLYILFGQELARYALDTAWNPSSGTLTYIYTLDIDVFGSSFPSCFTVTEDETEFFVGLESTIYYHVFDSAQDPSTIELRDTWDVSTEVVDPEVITAINLRNYPMLHIGAELNDDVHEYTLGFDEQPIRFMLNIHDIADPHWLVASNERIYKITGGNTFNFTKVATTYAGTDGTKWSGVDFHRHQIFNVDSGSDYPQVLLPGAVNFVDLTNWPANTYCGHLNAYKNFLIAYDITESGTNYKARIKWSDLADTGALPGSWDETDLTLLAGETDELERGGGRILCARILNDINYVYTENSVWYMYPRNDLRVWNFKEMDPRQGILGAHAITTHKNRHYLVTHGDVVVNDGRVLNSIIDQFNRAWLFDNIHEDYADRTQVVADPHNEEIMIAFADKSSTGWLNMALLWSLREKTWSQRSLKDFSYIASGFVDTSDDSDFIDDDYGIIDDDNSFIDAINYNPTLPVHLATKGIQRLFYQLNDVSKAALSEAVFERQGLTIVGRDRYNEWKHSAMSVKQVTRLYPKFSGVGSFKIYIGTSKTPAGAVTWSPAETYTIGSTPHVDFNVQGQAIAFKFEPQGTEAWVYSGCDLELHVISESTF